MDLRTGMGATVDVPRHEGPRGFVWSPNSRWLFTIDSSGRLVAIDRDTRTVHHLAKKLPPLAELTGTHGG